MFVFPLLYIGSFIISLHQLYQKKPDGFLVFLIFGLPLYTTALSIAHLYGYNRYIPLLQSFKEILIIVTFGMVLYHTRQKLQLLLIDQLLLAFFLYSLLYVFVPIGSYGWVGRLLAFKSLCFFVPVYFIGRFFDLKKLYIDQYFHFICLVAIFAALVLAYEVLTYTHFQTHTGYADFNYYFYNVEPGGNYGLTWTFEIGNGIKRFASFFANPLEHSASTLLIVSILAALYTNQKNQVHLDAFGAVVFFCTLFSITYSLSRASFVSYFLVIYVYASITKKKIIVQAIHFLLIAAVIYVLFLINNKSFREFILNTVNLSDSSSLGHILEWIDGVNAIIGHPLGLGLGESGQVANTVGQNVGGENQMIITGVQVGIIGLLLYVTIYIYIIQKAWRNLPFLQGKERKICFALLLMKIAFIIPLMTSNFESYTYISYFTWFITGLFANIISGRTISIDQKRQLA